MKAKTIDNSPHGWGTCIYDNEDCPMAYALNGLVNKHDAVGITEAFNIELSTHIDKETEKLQAEIDYIKREKLALNLLIDEITDGDCLKQSKAKLSAEIKELKAEVQKVYYAYRNMTRRYRKAIDKMEAQNKNVTNLQQTISHLNKMYNQAINDLTISQEKVERLNGDNEGEYEPYFGWCDVYDCGNEGCSGGNAWKETGYWTVCAKHSSDFRSGLPQPIMKQSAIDRENSRDKKTGYLPPNQQSK